MQPSYLGLRFGLCDNTYCISWVMPGGEAWDNGARPGMRVSSVNGLSLPLRGRIELDPSLPRYVTSAELVDSLGEAISVTLAEDSSGAIASNLSLWTLGAMFALLGAVVMLRRPDLPSARLFGLFTGSTALALAVGPSAGGPGPVWALVIQVITVMFVGASCLIFIASLAGYSSRAYRVVILPLLIGLGALILVSYAYSVLFAPMLYEWIRPVSFLYVSMSVLGAVVLMVITGNRQKSPTARQQARIALAGIVVGMFPFIGLTLIPEALGNDTLLPVQLTVLAVGFIPAFFAYAILQYQLLGIRRLVHRSMVYGIASITLLTIISIGLTGAFAVLMEDAVNKYSIPLISAIVVLGIICFYPLRTRTRWLVDRLVYDDVVDYQRLAEAVGRDLLAPGEVYEVASGMATVLHQALRLESVLLFLGYSPSQAQLVAAEGERSEEVIRDLRLRLKAQSGKFQNQSVTEMRWESDSLLIVSLAMPGKYRGYMVLGPKRQGEVFLEEEKQLVTTIIPILALAIDKGELSEQLREMNQRLVQAGEAERARIAADIHDGSLQKAMLLGGIGDTFGQDPKELARQLSSELREVCSRLRPAILDDLGIVAALEWLLDEVSLRHGLLTELSLNGVDEVERFCPEIELTIFRITQEASNNAVKHAKCARLRVSLSMNENGLTLEVSDDGVGFEPAIRGKKGLGLPGMNERVVQLMGRFDVRSAPGAGTKVIARIPIPDEPAGEDVDELSA